jgi:hypothetical protein
LVPAIDSVFSKHGNAAMFAGMGGCPPLLDVQFRQFRPISSSALLAMLDAMRLGPRLDCKWHNDAVLEWVIQHKIKTVILAAHWIVYVDTHAVPSAVAAHMVFADTRQPDNGSPPDGAAVFARGFDRMLSMLQRQHVKVFVVDDAPTVGVNVPYALASMDRLGERRDFSITPAAYEVQQQAATRILAALQDRYGFAILRPQDLLCASGVCVVERDGRSFYMDDEHLSPLGALAAKPAFERIWSPAD